MTTTEAAAALGISPQRVWALLQAGKLEGRKVGRDWWVDEISVQRRAESQAPKNPSARSSRSMTRNSTIPASAQNHEGVFTCHTPAKPVGPAV
jgi:excisionase family DNA binding protein